MKTPYQKSPKRIVCKSGIKGWTCKLQANYQTFDEFVSCCEIYGIHIRLGFNSPESAWKANPTIRGSVVHTDLQKLCKNGVWKGYGIAA